MNVFHGLVDEMFVYGRALDAEEMAKIPFSKEPNR
jgi:hypothetical protein